MSRIACAAAAVGLAASVSFAVPALAGVESTIIEKLFDKAEEIYRGKGFTPTGWSHQSALAQGGSESLRIALSNGRSYQIVGVCDTDCSDLDIRLLNSEGSEVDSDAQQDDFPIVGVVPSGNQTFTIRVSMAACSSAPCGYGVKAFVK